MKKITFSNFIWDSDGIDLCNFAAKTAACTSNLQIDHNFRGATLDFAARKWTSNFSSITSFRTYVHVPIESLEASENIHIIAFPITSQVVRL
jgi:hypothetical protein